MVFKEFPRLYAKASTGKVKFWEVQAFGLGEGSEDPAEVRIQYGYTDQDPTMYQNTVREVPKGKNLGRANQTTPFQQACLEAESFWNKKKDKKYVEDPSGNSSLLRPMLAHDYKKRGHKIEWPAFVQPKLNGCVFRTTKLTTDRGPMTIEEVVEGRLPVKVLSYNEAEGTLEFRKVLNWFRKGELSYENWLDVVPEFGPHVKCTADHRFLTTSGWKRADELDMKSDLLIGRRNGAYRNALIAGTLLGDSFLTIEKRHSGTSYRLAFCHTNEELFQFKVSLLNLEGRVRDYTSGYGSQGWRFTSTALTGTDFPAHWFYYLGHGKKVGQRKAVLYDRLRDILTPESIALWVADDGSLRNNNGNPNTPVLSIATHNHSEEQIAEFIKYFRRVWNLEPGVATSSSVRERGNCPGRFLNFSTKDTLYLLNFLRGKHIRGAEYKFYFPTEGYTGAAKDSVEASRFHVRKSRRMPKSALYDLEVEGNHNYVAGDVIIHNCRCIARKVSATEMEYLSRGGKRYETLKHLTPYLLDLLKVDEALDGEVYNHGGLTFQEICSAVKGVKTQKVNPELLHYWVYDRVEEEVPFHVRHLTLLNDLTRLPNPYILPVESTLVESETEMFRLHGHFTYEGFEGTIIRNRDGFYRCDFRSPDLQKYKDFIDEEFPIIGAKEGVGKDAGKVCWVCLTEEGKEFDARPRGTDEERRYWWENQEQFLGKRLTVRYQNRSDDGIPIFPVGINIRDYE